MAVAVLLAGAGMTIVKSHRKSLLAWLLRLSSATVLMGAALWIVLISIPFLRDPAVPTFSLVASAVLIAGLAAEELIGADLRRFFNL